MKALVSTVILISFMGISRIAHAQEQPEEEGLFQEEVSQAETQGALPEKKIIPEELLQGEDQKSTSFSEKEIWVILFNESKDRSQLAEILRSNIDDFYVNLAANEILNLCRENTKECSEDDHDAVNTIIDVVMYAQEPYRLLAWQYLLKLRSNSALSYFMFRAVGKDELEVYINAAVQELFSRRSCGRMCLINILSYTSDATDKYIATQKLLALDDVNLIILAEIVLLAPKESQKIAAWNKLLKRSMSPNEIAFPFGLIVQHGDHPYSTIARSLLEKWVRSSGSAGESRREALQSLIKNHESYDSTTGFGWGAGDDEESPTSQ